MNHSEFKITGCIFVVFLLFLFNHNNLYANDFQSEFCKINKKYIDLSKKTTKDLKLQLYKRKRKKELSNYDYNFENWVGKIQAIDSVGDEFAYVSISICENVAIKTWNNEFSDMMMSEKTLIHIDSDLYELLLDLEKGTKVKTSGSFNQSDSDHFYESSMTNKGSLSEPEYIVKFREIKKK